mmetsp:Transcript_154945/g.289043  ORF Transcript_154945/g.289043 Transcript_154945/m.289043 type:complete len:275 (-) Transcript_154945:36-860(-)
MALSAGGGGTCAVDIQAALDTVVEVVTALHGDLTPRSPFSATCRRWYSAAVCRPNAFRIPVQAWCARACAELDAQLLRLHAPPVHEVAEDLQIGLDHADEELRITDLSASFPSGVTVMLLNFTQQLGNLLTWLQLEAAHRATAVSSVPASSSATAAVPATDVKARRLLFRLEALEFRRRVALLSAAAQELQCRLPDPELPLRWAAWLDKAGETAGLPEGHRMRYRQQREQTATVWANNRRAFMSTVDHVNALMASLDRHEPPGDDHNDTTIRQL